MEAINNLITSSDVILGVLPFMHIYGLVVILCGAISRVIGKAQNHETHFFFIT